jgi:O-antigen/teichoic acid export membrane protein
LITDVGIALVALGLLGLLQNVDVVVLGRARPDATGAYAAISVASKALVFASLVLSSFLLPEAASRRHAGQHALRQLGGTLAIFAVPAALLLGFAVIAPDFLIRLAFGARYLSASDALLPLALAMTCLGASVLFTHYLLGAGHRRAVLALLVGTAIALPLLIAADGAPRATAFADLGVQAGLAAVTGGMVLLAALRPSGTRGPRSRSARSFPFPAASFAPARRTASVSAKRTS